MQVRPYRENDFRGIIIVERNTFGSGAYSNLMLKRMLNSPDGFTMVIDDGIKIHGYATMEPVNYEVIDIESIGILPEDQGKGYGSLLIKAMEKEAMKRSYLTVVLEVREKNDYAINFYKSRGYEKYEFIEKYYNISFRGSKNAYRMRKNFN